MYQFPANIVKLKLQFIHLKCTGIKVESAYTQKYYMSKVIKYLPLFTVLPLMYI